MITCSHCGQASASALSRQCICGVPLCDQVPDALGQDTASVLDDQSTLLLDPQLTRPVITPQSDMPAPDEAAIWLMTPSLIFDGATHSTSPYTLSYPQQPPPPPIYLLHWRTLMLHQWIAAGGFLVFVISLACGLALQSLPTHEAIATSTARAGGALTAVAPAITSHQMPSRSTPVAPQLSPPPSIVPLRDTHPQAVHAQKHSAHGQHHGKHPHRGHDDDG